MKNPEFIAIYFADPDVHDEQRVGTAGLFALVATVLLLFFHGLNTWWLIDGTLGFPAALVVHSLLVIVAGVLMWMFADDPKENRFFLLLLLTTSMLGVYGAAGTLLTLLLH